VGTADLLDMFLLDEPDTMFTIALGRDTFMDLTNWKWRRSRDILTLLEGRLLVIHRKMNLDGITTVNENSENNHNKNDVNMLNFNQLNQRVNQINQEIFMDSIKSRDECSEGKDDNDIQEKRIFVGDGPIRVIQIPTLSNVSSSCVRETTDTSLLLNWITRPVLDYMQKHKLHAFGE